MRRNPSYSQKDLPPRFILALNFSVRIFHGEVDERAPNLAMDLLRGEIKGVKGVTGANPIVATRIFANIRDMMLLMPTAEFLRLNKVSRVMYENVDYLMTNNMRALKRLFNNQPGDTQQIITKMNDYAARATYHKDRPEPLHWAFRQGLLSSFSHYAEESGEKINNIRDLVRLILRWVALPETNRWYSWRFAQEPSFKDWVAALTKAVAEMGGLYRNEQEWLIKGDSIKIPASTTIYVKDYYYRKAAQQILSGDKWVLHTMGTREDTVAGLVLFDDLIKRLREKYPVTILPPGKVEKAQMRLVQRYGFG